MIFCKYSISLAFLMAPMKFSKRHLSSTVAQFFYNDVYRVILPEGHRFPMEKYKIVRLGLQEDFSNRNDVIFSVSPMATQIELESTHCAEYISRFLSGNLTPLENRRIGFPWSLAGVQRATSSVGGTVAAMRSVCNGDSMISGHIAGGTHHAFYDYGEGFCVFNDIAVASNLALKEFSFIKKVLIIDLDVHQGNGNAVLFKDNTDVFTFSMHCKDNYFSIKQVSDIDIEVDAGTGDEAYLELLEYWLPRLLDHSQPDLVFFQAGVDVNENDRLGKLKLTRAGISRRNKLVYEAVREANAKLVVTMGGGYPKDLEPSSEPFRDIIQAHMDVYRDAVSSYA